MGSESSNDGRFSGGLHELYRMLDSAVWIVLGVCYFGVWWVYFHLRIKVIPYLGGLVALVAIADVSILLIEGGERIHSAFHSLLSRAIPSQTFLFVDHCVDSVADLVKASVKPYVPQWVMNHRPHLAILLSFVAIGLSCFMTWHHHRVAARVKQHQGLLSSLRRVTVEATELVFAKGGQRVGVFITRTLQMLAEALRLGDTQKSAAPASPGRIAVLLEKDKGASCFTLKKDWPKHYDQIPGLTSTSAAGEALKDASEIIYVPWTLFPHGARLRVREDRNPRYCDLEFAPNVFKDLGNGVKRPASLICTAVPTKNRSTDHVLCLDSTRWSWMSFDEIDFHTLHLVAGIIGMVIDSRQRDARTGSQITMSR